MDSTMDIGSVAVKATWPFTGISTALFFARLVSRTIIKKDLAGWDDLVLVLSWMLNIARQLVLTVSVSAVQQIDPADLPGTVPRAAMLIITADCIPFISVTLPKLAVGILIIRVLDPKRWQSFTILASCALLVLLSAIGLIITYAQCDPPAGQWDPWKHPNVKCWDRRIQQDYAVFVSAYSAVMDLAGALIPLAAFWKLQMPAWKKLSASGLMGLGVAAFAMAIKKLLQVTELDDHPGVEWILSQSLITAIWNAIENDLVIIAACLPTIAPVIRLVFGGLYSFGEYISTKKSVSPRPVSNNYHGLGEPANSRDDVELAHHGRPPAKSDALIDALERSSTYGSRATIHQRDSI